MSRKIDAITFTSNYKHLDLFLTMLGLKYKIDIENYEGELKIEKEKTKIYKGSIGNKISEMKNKGLKANQIVEELDAEILKYEEICTNKNIINICLLVEDEDDDVSKSYSILNHDLIIPNTPFINISIKKDIKTLELVDFIEKIVQKKGAIAPS